MLRIRRSGGIGTLLPPVATGGIREGVAGCCARRKLNDPPVVTGGIWEEWVVSGGPAVRPHRRYDRTEHGRPCEGNQQEGTDRLGCAVPDSHPDHLEEGTPEDRIQNYIGSWKPAGRAGAGGTG